MSVKRTTLTTSSIVLLALLFGALVILSNAFLRGWRVDLTENNLYTLSPGTKNIVGSLDEPVTLYYFFSDKASASIPVLRTYSTRVRETLEEFVLASNGKLKLTLVDPQPFSEEEDRAAQFGLQAIPIGTANENVYFGLAGTNSIDGVEVIPFFQPDKESFLEYDLTKLIYNLSQASKPVIGLLSNLPMAGGMDPATGRPSPPWVINDQMQQFFEVRNLAPNLTSIDEDIAVLMLVHPKELSQETQYAIDQFILGGGRAMIFLDPHAELETPAGNPQMAMFAEKSSNLRQLLDAWGVEIDSGQVMRDNRYALAVNIRANQPPIRHLSILSLTRDALAQDDVITSALSSVNLSYSGFIQAKNDSKVTLTPLLKTSNFAQPIAAEKVRFLPDPKELAKEFVPTGQQYIIAARLAGEVPSAFPDGKPKPQTDEGDPTTETAEDNHDHADHSHAEHLAQSKGPINVVLVADTDILSDRLWVRAADFFGQRVVSAWANNGDFIVNALDNLLGNSDLLSMRGRETSSRPFTTVQELERDADAKFRAKEQELIAELQETETKLNELQNSRDASTENLLILTSQQRAESEKFQQRKLEIRKELRQVRRDLDKDIEQLGNWMKFINIGAMPILLSIIALIMAFVVNARRRRVSGG